jgi:hypothetical protein
MSLRDGYVYAEAVKPGDVIIHPNWTGELTVKSVTRKTETVVRIVTEEARRPLDTHRFTGVQLVRPVGT